MTMGDLQQENRDLRVKLSLAQARVAELERQKKEHADMHWEEIQQKEAKEKKVDPPKKHG